MLLTTLAETDFVDSLIRAGDLPADKDRSRELVAVERRHHVLSLRRRGLSYQQIAETLGSPEQLAAAGLDWEPVKITARGVSALVRRYLNMLERETAESRDELRQLENERLDALYRKWLPKQDSKDPVEATRAAAILLKISDRRAKLNGLDAPTRVDHHHSGSIMHELGVDPVEIQRTEDAFKTAFGDDLETVDAPGYVELPSGDPEDS
jgi:hypothetical protein